MADDRPSPEQSREDGAASSGDRRSFLRTAAAVGAVGAVAGALHGKYGAAPLVAQAQAQTPAQTPWWPSKWGAADEAGATNHITPAKVLDAVRHIRDGRIYRLGRSYESAMPAFGGRSFALRMVGGPTGGPFGANKLMYNDEFVATEAGQAGTQFDGLGHIGILTGAEGDNNTVRYYNGFTHKDIANPYGLTKLGPEKLRPIVTRGHLFDIMAVRGAMMDVGQEITLADLRSAMQRQNLNEAEIRPGDAAFFHTGWGSLWIRNNDRYSSGAPGIGMEVARWIIEKDLCVAGADNWPVEVVPNPNRDLAFPVHTELITKNGIFHHENMVFDELLADRKYQFVYVFAPTPLKGATGSIGLPIAIT
jgi:kynurenine formamidase